MVICPKCNQKTTKPKKTWKYHGFNVETYTCEKCGTQFREYIKNGKHSFMLKLQKGQNREKTYVKV